jgi:hypothetical protein
VILKKVHGLVGHFRSKNKINPLPVLIPLLILVLIKKRKESLKALKGLDPIFLTEKLDAKVL